MAVRVFGTNHIVLEVGDIKEAVRFYTDVFSLEVKDKDVDSAFLYVGRHQFMALVEVDRPHVDGERHFGLIVRDPRDHVDGYDSRRGDAHTKRYGDADVPVRPPIPCKAGALVYCGQFSEAESRNRRVHLSPCASLPRSVPACRRSLVQPMAEATRAGWRHVRGR